jgi:hypothetical protein
MKSNAQRVTLSIPLGVLRAVCIALNIAGIWYGLGMATLFLLAPGRPSAWWHSYQFLVFTLIGIAPLLSTTALLLTSRETKYWWLRAIQKPYEEVNRR